MRQILDTDIVLSVWRGERPHLPAVTKREWMFFFKLLLKNNTGREGGGSWAVLTG